MSQPLKGKDRGAGLAKTQILVTHRLGVRQLAGKGAPAPRYSLLKRFQA